MHRRAFAVGLAARILLLGVLLASVWLIATRFAISTDLAVFLPESKTSNEKILLKQLGKGATSRLLFLSITGASELELRDVNKVFAAKLRSSPFFARVLNGEHEIKEADKDLIFKHRYMVAPIDVESSFEVDGLHQALQDRLRGLASSTAAFEKAFLARDPVGAAKVFIDQLLISQSETGPLRIDNVWMSRDRLRTLMIIEMEADAFNIEGQAAAIGELHREMAAIDVPGLSFTVTGPGAFAVEVRDTIRADVRLLTVLAVVFVAAFLFLAFRSARFVFLVVVPLALGIVVAIAAVLLVFGSIHGITLAFGVTLTGVAVDYPIHLVAQIPGSKARARDHVKRIWPTLRLGVMTTIIAYGSLVFSGFTGLTQLGIFTVAGLLTAAATTRWLLPHIIPTQIHLQQGMSSVHNFLESWGRRASGARIFMSLLIIVATAYLVLLDRPLRDDRLDSLSPIPEQRRTEDKGVRQDLGMWSGAKLMAIVAPDTEAVLRRSEELMPRLDKLIEQGVLSAYDTAAQYLPSAHLQRRRQANLPQQQVLRRRLAEALEGLPFRKDVFEPFIADVEAARETDPVTLETLSETNLLPLLSPLLFELDGTWVSLILLHDVTDADRLSSLSTRADDTETIYLDLKKQSHDIMERAMSRVLRLLAWGALFIYLVLALNFRNLRKPLYILIPTSASVVLVTAILVAVGIQLTVFHLVALLLVVGLGLDYALFFNRLTDSDEEWATTFRALWVCCVTTVLVFGMLLLSDTPPLEAVGLTVSVGAGFCLLLGAVWSSSVPPSGRLAQRLRARMNTAKGAA